MLRPAGTLPWPVGVQRQPANILRVVQCNHSATQKLCIVQYHNENVMSTRCTSSTVSVSAQKQTVYRYARYIENLQLNGQGGTCCLVNVSGFI